jgi:hypothetical protein
MKKGKILKKHCHRLINKNDSQSFTYCGGLWANEKVTDDHKKATCLRCIISMNIREQLWHQENNQEWINFNKK